MTQLAAPLLAGLAVVVLVGRARWAGQLTSAWAGPLVGLALLPVGLAAGVAGGLVAAAARRALTRRRQAAGQAAERASAIEAVAALAAELRAGRAVPDALLVASGLAEGPTGLGLAGAGRALRLGADPVPLLQGAAAESAAGPALRGLAACLAVCAGSGASLARAVDTVAAALREEAEQRLAVETELAGPRATALLLAGLPVAGTAMAAALGAHPLQVLLHTVVGGTCLVVGVVLDLLGLTWTERLVARASP